MPGAARFIVAVDGARGLAIGAAAMADQRRSRPWRGPGIAVHVIQPCRRRGVGRALCDEVARLAVSEGDEALYLAQRVEMNAPDMKPWQQLKFDVCETVHEHELPLAALKPLLAPLVDRFRRRGRIPANASIVPLFSADRDAVLQLHLQHMGGDRASLWNKLTGNAPGAFHPRYSCVLVVGGRTLGCILGHRTSETLAVVDAMIVAPELRGGWANLWLKLEGTRNAMSQGVSHFQFTTFDQYADTRSFTDRLGGVTKRAWALMAHRLT